MESHEFIKAHSRHIPLFESQKTAVIFTNKPFGFCCAVLIESVPLVCQSEK